MVNVVHVATAGETLVCYHFRIDIDAAIVVGIVKPMQRVIGGHHCLLYIRLRLIVVLDILLGVVGDVKPVGAALG